MEIAGLILALWFGYLLGKDNGITEGRREASQTLDEVTEELRKLKKSVVR